MLVPKLKQQPRAASPLLDFGLPAPTPGMYGRAGVQPDPRARQGQSYLDWSPVYAGAGVPQMIPNKGTLPPPLPQSMYVPMQPPPPVQVTPLNPPQPVGEANLTVPADSMFPISPMARGLYGALSQPGGEQIAQTATSSVTNALAGSSPPGFWSRMGAMASSPYFPPALALAGQIAASASRPGSAGRQIADIGSQAVAGLSQVQRMTEGVKLSLIHI